MFGYLLQVWNIGIYHSRLRAFMKWDQWIEIDKYQCEGNGLALVFGALLRSVTTALEIVDLRPRETIIAELEADGNPTRFSRFSDILAFQLFASLSVKYSNIPWPEPENCQNLPERSQSGSVGWNRDPKRPCLDHQRGRGPSTARCDPEKKREEEVMDLLLPAVSSDLRGDAIDTLVVQRESMYPVCSIHYMDPTTWLRITKQITENPWCRQLIW